MDEWFFHCKILGVPKDATPAEIKSAYMAQAKLFHPDKHQNDPTAKQKFQQLQESYNYLKKNSGSQKAEKPAASSEAPIQTKRQSQAIWILVSVICLGILIVLGINWPKKNQPVVSPKPIENLSSEQIKDVLLPKKLFIFQMGSNQSCTQLQRGHVYYQELVSATERFTNRDCGDVRAFFNKLNIPQIVFVVSPSLESCQCQAKFLKSKPKLDTKKKSFDDSDLQ